MKRSAVLLLASFFLWGGQAEAGSGVELWRGPEGRSAETCRIALSTADAAVEVRTVTDGPAVLLGDDARSSVSLSSEDGKEDDTTRLVATGDGPLVLRLPPRCAVSVETVTGAVVYRAEPESDATVFLATSGEITVDFSVEIEYRHHQEPSKYGQVTVGDGGTRVELTSRRGAVSILGAATEMTEDIAR